MKLVNKNIRDQAQMNAFKYTDNADNCGGFAYSIVLNATSDLRMLLLSLKGNITEYGISTTNTILDKL